MKNKNIIKYIFQGITILSLSGCSSLPSLNSFEVFSSDSSKNELPSEVKYSIHQYAAKLVSQLLSSPLNVPVSAKIAVGTFMPQARKATSKELEVGLQLQESINTLLVQSGFKLAEYKLRKTIKINPNHDQFLSQNPVDINKTINAKYLIVGTLNSQQFTTQVNMRLVDSSNQSVLGASTIYIPNDILWGSEKITSRSGKLTRTEY